MSPELAEAVAHLDALDAAMAASTTDVDDEEES